MDLILWRHAGAEDGRPDEARPLTARGRKQARGVAKWLAKRLPPRYTLLVSPAVRARETAAPLSERGRVEERVEERVGLGARAPGLLEAAGWPEGEGTVVVVGHQPTLGEAAGILLAREAVPLRIRKGALWWFRIQRRGDRWEATLLAVVDPDLL